MLPTGLAGLEAQLWVFLVAMIRPGAAFLAAPVFGAQNIPVQVRLIISLAVGIPAIQQVPFDLPAAGLVTVMGFMLVAGEIIAGLAIGFAVQLGYASAMMAGEVIGNAMGIGFANMVDPQSGASSTALGQFLSILGTFLFLAMNGHLMLATIIVDSYHSLPPGQAWLGQGQMRDVVMFGGDMIAAGMAIALPVGFALILVQVVMAMLARSAPAMNLFSVGMPATILAGVVLLAIAAPAIGDGIATSIERGLDLARSLASAKGG
ncbi:flagellar biosynthetic protein FliR [Sphingomonas sp. CGMCC 1.13654]|uniref:Flagellar biosynthetic protein FliR n=1 Tax=Sphingomonas chungangi TaxID=2683589 RepID=A0A838L3I9_9SPHN|nr:flagellar biosynthetic protein FliR [Sphingomonas chungangi]MBA2932959.1 flagellar biosynthetic protein FliR [Sphingomonas chungangi]MVW56579.1 flagellar biosynthetic protein FliR [Sphingomonas chungangi]